MKAHHWHLLEFSAILVLFLALLVSSSIQFFSSYRAAKAFQYPSKREINISQHPSERKMNIFAYPSSNVVIMPLGDSITFGVGSPSHSSYRLGLWQLLTEAGIRASFVGSLRSGSKLLAEPANEGHSGWHIRRISEHIVGWLQTTRPEYVLLHIGTNDILFHDDVAQAPARLRFLIDQITETLPGVTVLVAQITPLAPKFEPQVEVYNRAMLDIVREEVAVGKRAYVVDIHDAVPLSDMPDMVHPNDTGYTLMARAWYQALLPLLRSQV